MNDFTAARKRLYLWAKELHEVADEIDEESGDLLGVRVGVLEQAALIADQVEATARPGDGKDAAAEIGRRIRALMEEGRHEAV